MFWITQERRDLSGVPAKGGQILGMLKTALNV
jgi:hypothetical protein